MNKFSDGKIVGWIQSKCEDINTWESESIASFISQGRSAGLHWKVNRQIRL